MSSEIEAERYWASVTAAPDAKEVVTGGTGDVSADVRALRDDLARLRKAFAAMSRVENIVVPARRGLAVRDVARDATDGPLGARTEIARSARRHAAAFADDLKATVRRNPQGTLLAAFGLGMVVGMARLRRAHRFG